MNILMFGWEFPPFVSGGLGVACFEMTKALTSMHHSVFFVMPERQRPISSPSDRLSESDPDPGHQVAGDGLPLDNLTLLRLPSGFQPYVSLHEYEDSFLSGKNGLSTSVIYGKDLFSEVRRYGREAAELAASIPCDVIHAHDWMTIPAALHARDAAIRPWVFHVHSLEYDRAGERANPDIVALEKDGMEKADRVIAVSARTKTMIVERYGVAPEKISVIHNAVSRGENRRHRDKDPNHRPTVLFLGRITFQKGPEYFVEAAALVLEKMADAIFIMAGDGDMAEQVMRRVNALGIAGSFHFTGFLQGEKLERAFLSSDLYVMPSVSEPFGISPLEAVAYDIPVIISRQSGVSEILKNALKVDFWDVKEMASLIISTLKRPALGETMTREAHSELKDMQWKTTAEKIVAVYDRLIHHLPNDA